MKFGGAREIFRFYKSPCDLGQIFRVTAFYGKKNLKESRHTRAMSKIHLGRFGMGSKRSGSFEEGLSKKDNLRPEKQSGYVKEDIMCGAREASCFENGSVQVIK